MNALQNIGICVLLALGIAGCSPSEAPPTAAPVARSPSSTPIVIAEGSKDDQRESLVGHYIKLEGTVTNSKMPSIMGVDVEMPSEPIAGSTTRTVIDLRGKKAFAVGILQRDVVTTLPHEMVANRGLGTFYSLIDPKTGNLAVAQAAE